ncbi:hypothetical protein [Pelosinus sp. IPA-1]|uniref:hypothetical protein n=1 Tax=Pelosinus sp. IPA-1 TaxID=3029569 RepID=UPI0024362A4B|nr:hypothetical protein [Pelosinus sp. IPA-1]GMB01865.1 hypothetical protein PIPA1_46650 [Pelosinus sp. IPA-1]
MSKISNFDIHTALIGRKKYKVAELLGITEFTFSRWLRHELPEEKKTLILQAINKLAGENS